MVEKIITNETSLAEPTLDGATTGLGVIAGLAATAAATCCVLPIALTILGLGGGWLVVLGYLTGARVYILAAAGLIFIGAVLLAWRRPTGKSGSKGQAIAFSFTAVLLLAAATAPFWERPTTEFLWNVWVSK